MRFAQLAAKLRDVNAVPGGFAGTDEDHRNIPSIALTQNRIGVDVYFAERRSKLSEQRRNGGTSFVAQMAARTRVQRDFARASRREPQIFGMFAHGFGLEYFWNGPECGWNA